MYLFLHTYKFIEKQTPIFSHNRSLLNAIGFLLKQKLLAGKKNSREIHYWSSMKTPKSYLELNVY